MGLIAKINYKNICFTTEDQEGEVFHYELPIEGSLNLREINGTFITRVVMREELKKYPETNIANALIMMKLKCIKYQKSPRWGPFLSPGFNRKQEIKGLFIDYKISRDERDKIPLVCDGDEIMGSRIQNQ